MKLIDNAKMDLLDLAKTTKDRTVLTNLSQNPNSTIRRAVARNIYSNSNILEVLSKDPVQNVAYMAVQNPNCLNKRDFSQVNHPCVICEKDERYMVCENCPKLVSYYD